MESKLITIQSMTTTKTADTEATIAQIKHLEAHGCDIVRVAVPDMESADAIAKIKENIIIPLVADIHFDHKLALRAVERGADKIRINPGNIGGSAHSRNKNVKALADACNSRGIPIRIGVNSGSLEKSILAKHGGITADAMVESALGHVALLNKYNFDNIWISAKTSNVPLTVKTYRLLREQTDYPLHIGITEAGTEYAGIIKSAIGIGALLLDGIGDTIRVSLTAEPEREVIAAKAILKALGLRPGLDIISCPTCGRAGIDIINMAHETEQRLVSAGFAEQDLTVAVMGCAVNGPGEASHADFGIAGLGAGQMVQGDGSTVPPSAATQTATTGTKNTQMVQGDGSTVTPPVPTVTPPVPLGIIFAKGKVIKKVPGDKLVDELIEIIKKQ